ncbi:MAG: RNA methyltransferase [Clostridia bacterium]|nr:RNA methyltransferase [Clostridia bacterium]
MEKIVSKTNPKIKNVSKLVASSSFRKETGLFCIEGLRLCMDAVKSNVQIQQTFFSDSILKKHPVEAEQIESFSSESYEVNQEVFSKISDTGSPQGVLCVCKKCENVTDEITLKNDGKYVFLENVQDPSNLGTVCRTAEALGIDAAILCGCCDIFNPKVLRGSMGAVFRLKIGVADSASEFLKKCNEQGFKTFATVTDKNAEKITGVSFDGGVVCVIGNEGNGVSREVIDICSQKITIPMLGRAQSLNASAAACITMWEMLR